MDTSRKKKAQSVPVHFYTEPAGMIPSKKISFQLDKNGDLSLRALDLELEVSGIKVVHPRTIEGNQN
jgi:hypothetical protein